MNAGSVAILGRPQTFLPTPTCSLLWSSPRKKLLLPSSNAVFSKLFIAEAETPFFFSGGILHAYFPEEVFLTAHQTKTRQPSGAHSEGQE